MINTETLDKKIEFTSREMVVEGLSGGAFVVGSAVSVLDFRETVAHPKQNYETYLGSINIPREGLDYAIAFTLGTFGLILGTRFLINGFRLSGMTTARWLSRVARGN